MFNEFVGWFRERHAAYAEAVMWRGRTIQIADKSIAVWI